ncbi:MobQ family relaxase [Ancylobacter terrae]|uniref:MobQ family relaxase n=1 Tax=Ancylobacter sp. sgz301288 TaxID=3342077 RepID=UPI00385CB3C6
MALFSWSMQVIKRSSGRSAVAAAAYRAGEKLHDERADVTHDYRRRSGVEHTEIMAPQGAPAWVHDRQTLWNRVEASEKRKDAQVCRELRIMLPRELSREERIALLRDYIGSTFVSRGMVADIAVHNKVASDGQEQPHAHVMLTMRPLEDDGFGKKSRHDWVHHPDGLTHDDGKPVLVMSNAESWNSPAFFDQAREAWEKTANDALADAGSAARIDRRSLLERGLARMPEPALRMAWHMKELYGGMKDRFGQYLAAKHFRRVEDAARDAFAKLEKGQSKVAKNVQTVERFVGWFERQIDRLAPDKRPELARDTGRGFDR